MRPAASAELTAQDSGDSGSSGGEGAEAGAPSGSGAGEGLEEGARGARAAAPAGLSGGVMLQHVLWDRPPWPSCTSVWHSMLAAEHVSEEPHRTHQSLRGSACGRRPDARPRPQASARSGGSRRTARRRARAASGGRTTCRSWRRRCPLVLIALFSHMRTLPAASYTACVALSHSACLMHGRVCNPQKQVQAGSLPVCLALGRQAGPASRHTRCLQRKQWHKRSHTPAWQASGVLTLKQARSSDAGPMLPCRAGVCAPPQGRRGVRRHGRRRGARRGQAARGGRSAA
jgi:hypothetical protein